MISCNGIKFKVYRNGDVYTSGNLLARKLEEAKHIDWIFSKKWGTTSKKRLLDRILTDQGNALQNAMEIDQSSDTELANYLKMVSKAHEEEERRAMLLYEGTAPDPVLLKVQETSLKKRLKFLVDHERDEFDDNGTFAAIKTKTFAEALLKLI